MPETISTNPVRGVVFDVDGTLYHQKPLRYLMAGRILLAALARPARTRRDIGIIAHYRRAQEWLREHPDYLADRPDRQFLRAAEVSGIHLAEVKERASWWLDTAPLPLLGLCARRGLISWIRRWHARGVPMGVYSDYPAAAKVERLGLGFLAANCVASSDPGVCALKPSPAGFLAAAARLGLAPEEVVYVGDRPEVDVRGARAAGMEVALIGPKAGGGASPEERPTMRFAELEDRLREAYG